MGLSVCYGIIERHNGRIEVRSAVGQGATFIIELPLHPVESLTKDLSVEESPISAKEHNRRPSK